MPSKSFTFRIGSNVHNSTTSTITFRRGLEYDIKEGIKQNTFRRGLEYDVVKGVESKSFTRGLEYDIAGSIQSVSFRRGIEYDIQELPNFESNQARFLQKVIEPIKEVRVQSREIVFTFNPRMKYKELIRVGSRIVKPIATTGLTMLFSAFDYLNQKINDEKEFTQQVDASAQFNWTGSFDSNDRFGVGYTRNNEFFPIQKSLPITKLLSPILDWSPIFNPESPEQYIEYIIQLSDTFTMRKLILETITTQSSISLSNFGITLEYNKTYYWRIKSRDHWNGKILDESDWTNIFHFTVQEEIIDVNPLNVSELDWNNPFLLPPNTTNYIWNTSNLLPYDLNDINKVPYIYEFVIYWYRFISGQSQPSLQATRKSSEFKIKHSAANPPIFLSAVYDEQNHHIVFKVQINDSLGRKYQIKDFEYLNIDDGIQNQWTKIDDHRILGLKTNLNSVPISNDRGIISWDGSYDADHPNYQDIDYNLRVLKEPVNRNNDFYYILQAIDEDDVIDVLEVNSSYFGSFWNTKFKENNLPKFVDNLTGIEYRLLDDYESKTLDNNYGDDIFFSYPFRFVSKTIHINLKYSYSIKDIKFELNEDMMKEKVIITATFYNNGLEVLKYSDYEVTQKLIDFPFSLEVDRVTLIFNSKQYPKLNSLNIYSDKLIDTNISNSDLIYVNTEKTDVVMKDLLISPQEYFQTSELGKIYKSEGEDSVSYTYYGANKKYRVLLFRDSSATDLLYVKVDKAEKGGNIKLTNYELFYENITNIILNFRNIPFTFYELTYSDIQMLETKIGNSDYWVECRSRDYYTNTDNVIIPIEYSVWSGFAIRKPSNIYTLKWNIKGLAINPTKSVYFKCKAVLSSLNKNVEIPIFGFAPSTNISINSLEAEKLASEVLKLQTEQLVTELQSKINSVITDNTIIINF